MSKPTTRPSRIVPPQQSSIFSICPYPKTKQTCRDYKLSCINPDKNKMIQIQPAQLTF